MIDNKIICNKLVRDLLPEIYAKQGKTCVTENLELEEFAAQLMQLLDEEMVNFKNAFNEEDDELAVKKIADVVEILYAVLDLIGVPEQSFEKIRLANKQKYGGYEKRILLKEISDVLEKKNNISDIN